MILKTTNGRKATFLKRATAVIALCAAAGVADAGERPPAAVETSAVETSVVETSVVETSAIAPPATWSEQARSVVQTGVAAGAAAVGRLGEAGGYAFQAATAGARQAYEATAAAGRNAAQFGWELSFLLGMSGPAIDPAAPLPSSSPMMESGEPPGPARPALTPAFPAAPPPAASPPALAVSAPAAPSPAASPPAASPPVASSSAASPPAASPPALQALPPTESPAEIKRPPVEALIPVLGDMPRREANGDFFVPKAMQRLLDVRTTRAEGGVHAVRLALPGRIIPDPNAGGLVEASVMGRIEPPEGGLPTLGQRVRKGDVLAYVAPAIGVVDRTQIRRDVARLTNEIRAESENLDILQRFSFVPFREGKIVQARMRLEGLRRERAALLPLLDTREALRSPADGVVSEANVVAGQVLQPGQPAFEIVDPDRLWIEASAAEPAAAAIAADADSVAAATPEGLALDVEFSGAGLSMREQSALLHYVVKHPSEGLRVGRPVTVYVARRDRSLTGVAVPHEAVVSGPGGLDEVWEHVDAEHFRPHPVRAEMLDGRRMLIPAGLEAGARVVTHSARLLAQYQ